MTKPLNKPESPKTNSNLSKKPNKPSFVASSKSQANLQNQNFENKRKISIKIKKLSEVTQPQLSKTLKNAYSIIEKQKYN